MSIGEYDYMQSLRRKDVEERAEAIIVSLEIEEPPVNPMWIAERLGYTLRSVKYRSPDIHGSVSVRDAIVFIDFRADDPSNRQRFTIAHEIGHARLHLLKEGAYDEGVGYIDSARTLYRLKEIEAGDGEEREANQFAAALLMPAQMVRRLQRPSASTLDLAFLFNVSEEAMSYRIKNLGSLRQPE